MDRDRIKVINNIPVNSTEMSRLHTFLAHRLKISTEDLVENIRYLYEALGKIRHYSCTDVAGRNFIPHRYAEATTGRLYAIGSNSLQTTPRLVRTAVLRGSYDYDIENCHYAIFSQLAKEYGYECKQIRGYLANKHAIRKRIAERVEITEDQAKRCLLALMFGARLTEWKDNAIPQIIGKDKASRLFKDPQFEAIADDILQGRKTILISGRTRTAQKCLMLWVRQQASKKLPVSDWLTLFRALKLRLSWRQ